MLRKWTVILLSVTLTTTRCSYVNYLCLKDKEVSKGGSAPRMLCLDDYFMIEVDKIEKDTETGKRVKKKVN